MEQKLVCLTHGRGLFKIDLNFARAIDTRGHIFEALGRRDEAIAESRRALSIGQTDLVIQKSSGAGLVRLGATQDALPQKSLTDIVPAEVPAGDGVLRPRTLHIRPRTMSSDAVWYGRYAERRE